MAAVALYGHSWLIAVVLCSGTTRGTFVGVYRVLLTLPKSFPTVLALPIMSSSPFIKHFLIGICALSPDAPPVAALAAEDIIGVHDFLMYEDYAYDDFEYTICDPDGRVTTYVLNATYCHLLKSLHRWLRQLVLENSPSILRDLGHRKFSRKHFEFFLEKAQIIRAAPAFNFPILDILPSRVITSYVWHTPAILQECSQECMLPSPASTYDHVEVEESFSGSRASSPLPVIDDGTINIECTALTHIDRADDCSIPITPTVHGTGSTIIYGLLSQTMGNDVYSVEYTGELRNPEEEIIFYRDDNDGECNLSTLSDLPYDSVVSAQFSTST